MSKNYKRRDFIKNSTTAIAGLSLGGLSLQNEAFSKPTVNRIQTMDSEKTLRIGFVGVGDRGSYHLDAALGIEGVVVPAVCDIKDAALYRAKRWVEEAGQPTPTLYGKSDSDFVRMCEQEDLDVVICATSWKWHTKVCPDCQ